MEIMPVRETPLINDSIYHVFNKSIESKLLLIESDLCSHFFDLAVYYRSNATRISFSKFSTLLESERETLMKKILQKESFKVEILSYCFMPTHFHFLIRQIFDHGIENFMGDVANAFTRFYNIKYDRKGPLFLPRFKGVLIQSHEQLIHVSRYIHLNPYSSGVVVDLSDLEYYRWSSYRSFSTPGVENVLCDGRMVLSGFNMNKDTYRKFVEGNADNQRALELLKHIERWK